MARPTRLTADFVDSVSTEGRFSDGRGGNGLTLRVRLGRDGVTLRRTWEQRLSGGGQVFTLGLGSFPDLRLQAARVLAAEQRRSFKLKYPRRRKIDKLLGEALAAYGLGPVAVEAPSPAPTFGEAVETYIEAQAGRWKSGSKTQKQARSQLSGYAAALMDTPVNLVDSGAVVDVLAPIWHEKAPTAKKLFGHIRSVLRYAIGMGWVDQDVSERTRLALGKQGHQTEHVGAVPYAEVPAALDYFRDSRTFDDKKMAIELLILTGARTSEVRGMRGREVDWFNFTWTIPAARMKGGRDHRIPLSRAAMALIRPTDADDLVFTAESGKMLSQDGFRSLLKRRYPDATPHGFRSAFRDWAAEKTDYPAEIAEHALAHLEGSESVRAYLRTDYFEKRRALMAEWAEYVKGEGGQLLLPVP